MYSSRSSWCAVRDDHYNLKKKKILPVVVAAVVVAVVAANFYRLSSSGALQPDQGGVQDLELTLEICLDVQHPDDVL